MKGLPVLREQYYKSYEIVKWGIIYFFILNFTYFLFKLTHPPVVLVTFELTTTMERSKSIDILRSLSEEELKQFKDFLSSPFFNTNGTLLKLFEALRKYYPDFPPSKIAKEKIFKKLYPGKSFNEQVMKNLISDFIKSEKEFLSQLYFRSAEHDKEMSLIRMMNRKKLDSLYHSESKKYRQELENIFGVDNDYFYYLFLLEHEERNYMLSRNRQHEVPAIILKRGEYLIFHFIQQFADVILELCINEDNYNAVFEVNLPKNFLESLDFEKVIQYLEQNNMEHASAIAVEYYSVMAYIHHTNDDYYFKLRDYVYKYLESSTPSLQSKFVGLLEQVLIKKTNHGQHNMYTDLFNTYRMLDEKKFYMTRWGYLPVSTCRNVIVTAINAEQPEWGFDFLKRSIKHMDEEFRDNMYNLLSAHLYFYTGNFEKSLELLTTVRYDQHAVKIDVKTFMLKIYYELSYMESALSLIDSFRRTVANDKLLTSTRKERYLNFLSLTGSLIKISGDRSDKAAIEKLKGKLDDPAFLATSKSWVSKKLEEIESGSAVKAG